MTSKTLRIVALFAAAIAVLSAAVILFRAASAGPKGDEKYLTNSVGMKLVRVPAGKFLMGSTDEERVERAKAAVLEVSARKPEGGGVLTEKEWLDQMKPEGPQHRVWITQPFYLGVYQVTQKQFKEVMGYNPSFYSKDGTMGPDDQFIVGLGGAGPAGGAERVAGLDTDDFPVEMVSWNEAVRFCEKLSALPGEKKAGRHYRLPSEAKWEYACRAGADLRSAVEQERMKQQARFAQQLGRTYAVGSLEPNGFGLYDMPGNVREWCADNYRADYYAHSPVKDPFGPDPGPSTARVMRGGGGLSGGATSRQAYPMWKRGIDMGFRVATAARQ